MRRQLARLMLGDPSIKDPDVRGLLDSLTIDNWFTQLAIMSDRFQEIGDQGKADRCDDLVVCGKKPANHHGCFHFSYRGYDLYKYKKSEIIPKKTMEWIDHIVGWSYSKKIKYQLIPYLVIPQSLRLRRPKK